MMLDKRTLVLLSLTLSQRSTLARAQDFAPGVLATGTQGVTNPPVPTLPTTIDQTSMARLLSINSIDDFCIFAPPSFDTIPNTETVEVAWCTQPRNNARVIPDGTLSGVSFLHTPFYIQVFGFGNLTNLNIAPNDAGGELDPHGAFGTGNPVGGNVSTTIIDGFDRPLAEWMLFIDWQYFCLRICTNANTTYDPAHMCWHELDEMGCEFVMPGQYNFQGGVFETCDADAAYPPGWYPQVVNGQTTFSTFAQYFTGVYTGADGQPTGYTVGDTVTPTAPATIPQSSNCVTQATIANGIPLISLTPGAKGTAPPPGFSSVTATFVANTLPMPTSSVNVPVKALGSSSISSPSSPTTNSNSAVITIPSGIYVVAFIAGAAFFVLG
ncbi:hypothetical protein MIND_00173800 [Mycena indigotica]|uniref:Mannoprotein n=1 Tax=Mycena indigotica TaxID=2126181 RepID=A0A8H6TFF5_9AGAR|nr:uncharacterized protein MIND_00173800 [Mycena indigotica]KAF7316545.1 hypothetical protein MIND_00173800 [Mycena indigotica]